MIKRYTISIYYNIIYIYIIEKNIKWFFDSSHLIFINSKKYSCLLTYTYTFIKILCFSLFLLISCNKVFAEDLHARKSKKESQKFFQLKGVLEFYTQQLQEMLSTSQALNLQMNVALGLVVTTSTQCIEVQVKVRKNIREMQVVQAHLVREQQNKGQQLQEMLQAVQRVLLIGQSQKRDRARILEQIRLRLQQIESL